jgi:hypothetical protein
LINLEGNVFESINIIRSPLGAAVVGLADLEVGILLATDEVPPPVDVMSKGARADFAEAVELGDIFDADDGAHAFGKTEMLKTEKLKGRWEENAEKLKTER